MKLFFKIPLFVAFLALSHPTLHSQPLEHKIDSLISAKFNPDNPGAVFLVAKNGMVIYRKAFGKANLELNVAMKPEHVFEIGSMTKQFTAVSILMLAEQGKLNLEDDITCFIPDFPAGKIITVHHLLTHTSGIKNFTDMPQFKDILKDDISPLKLIDLFKNESLDFAPGEQFKYNNSGYVILGYIIESVSGQDYGEFVQKNIFERAGMTSSYHGSHQKIIKNRASGYNDKNGYVNRSYISYTLPYASGSLMSNADDMLKWQEALENNILVKKSTIEKAFTNYTLNDGSKINYGYGWHLKNIEGIPTREHGGSIVGFKSMGIYVTGKNIYVIGLTNCTCNSPTEITKAIAALTITDKAG